MKARAASSVPLSGGTDTNPSQVECHVQIHQDAMTVTPQTASARELCGPGPSYPPQYSSHHTGKTWGFPPKIQPVNWFPSTFKAEFCMLLLALNYVLSVCSMLKFSSLQGVKLCNTWKCGWQFPWPPAPGHRQPLLSVLARQAGINKTQCNSMLPIINLHSQLFLLRKSLSRKHAVWIAAV